MSMEEQLKILEKLDKKDIIKLFRDWINQKPEIDSSNYMWEKVRKEGLNRKSIVFHLLLRVGRNT